MKKVYKYATGEKIPKGAIYLNTITQTKVLVNTSYYTGGKEHEVWKKCWLVWHYFLVEVKDK